MELGKHSKIYLKSPQKAFEKGTLKARKKHLKKAHEKARKKHSKKLHEKVRKKPWGAKKSGVKRCYEAHKFRARHYCSYGGAETGEGYLIAARIKKRQRYTFPHTLVGCADRVKGGIRRIAREERRIAYLTARFGISDAKICFRARSEGFLQADYIKCFSVLAGKCKCGFIPEFCKNQFCYIFDIPLKKKCFFQ